MALTLNGTTRWPTNKELQRLGETRMGGTPAKIKQILGQIHEAMSETIKDVHSYVQKNPPFAEIGGQMLKEWEAGISTSLRAA